MSLRYIAYYLPQFHPFPENDRWWGKGFTEWTNVAKAAPLYPGHNQPRYPTDFGYYDLRVQETVRDQIEVAKAHGIDAFCFHYYWFDGKRLMEKPVDAFLADESADISFCLCWANENWTRRWDAAEHEVLIAQSYGEDWELRFIESLFPYFKDPRYLRVDGKPILVVYRPQHIPDAREAGRKWREHCRNEGIGEIHIINALVHGNNDYEQYEFDAGVEFPPHNMNYHGVNELLPTYEPYNGYAVEYANVARDFLSRDHSNKRIYRTVFPDWDNTARVKDRALIVLGSTVANYERWLRGASSLTLAQREPSDQLVFINAWNEWAEGCYLEPDRFHGRGYLEATRSVKTGQSLVNDLYDVAPERTQFELSRQTPSLEQADSQQQPDMRPVEELAQLSVPEPGSIPKSFRVRVAHRLAGWPVAYNTTRFVYRAAARMASPVRNSIRQGLRQQGAADDLVCLPAFPRSLIEISLDDVGNKAPSLKAFLSSKSDTVWTPFEKQRVSPKIPPELLQAAGTKNGDAFRLMLDNTAYDAYPLTLGRFFNSVAHPLGCAVVTSKSELIGETMRVYRFFKSVMNVDYLKDTEAGPVQTKPAGKFIDADVVLAFHRSQAFGHLIFDSLPTILTLLEAIKAGRLKILLPNQRPSWFESILSPFGILPHHCLILPDGDQEAYRFRSIIVSSGLTTFTSFFPHPRSDVLFQAAYDELRVNSDRTTGSRLYIIRNAGRTTSTSTTFSGRTISNGEQVEEELGKRGFDFIEPASLPYGEQAKLFRDADVIVGAHGSAFANLIWAKPGTQVIDLVPDDWINFWGAGDGIVELWVARICAMRGLRYQAVLCSSSSQGSWETSDSEMRSEVDVDLLRERLGEVLAVS